MSDLAPICPYCGHTSEMVSGREMYPTHPELWTRTLYRCRPCQAHVGCHKGTVMPLGRLANAELRAAKIEAHRALDPLWQDGGPLTRSQAYAWLARQLNIPSSQCHIGHFDVAQCRQVVAVCEERLAVPA